MPNDVDDDPEAVSAAYAFVDSMAPAANDGQDGCPVWHGWALRAAYLAGVRSTRPRIAHLERELAKALEAHEEP